MSEEEYEEYLRRIENLGELDELDIDLELYDETFSN